jgi:glycosyltransferase involved in cell wall biosynthesis
MVCREFIDVFTSQREGHELVIIAPGEFHPLSDTYSPLTVPDLDGAWRTLRFEQFELPRIVRDAGADALLMLYRAAPLGSPVPVVLFEALGEIESRSGIGWRLLQAVRAAGAQGASQYIIPRDLKSKILKWSALRHIEPWVHPNFRALSDPEDHRAATRHGLPNSYVIAHGISLPDVRTVLASWSWVDGSVGDSVPLAVIASEGLEGRVWEHEIESMRLGHSVRLLTEVSFEELPSLYRRAEAMLLGGRAVEHQLLRWAMACGVPVTGFDVPAAADALGSAGYLVKPGDARALGAACLTVIVEPEIKDRLRQEGLLRASAFHANENPLNLLNELFDGLAV